MRLLSLALAATLLSVASAAGHAQAPSAAAGAMTVVGSTAAQSAPARAFAVLLEAVARSDVAAIRRLLAQGHPGLRMLTPQGLRAMKAEFLPDGADPAAVMARLENVTLAADRATLTFAGPDGATIWKMTREAGGWRLSY
jgi:hypothetical protein